MSRIIGCKNLHIAELVKDDATGVQWKTPVPVKSLISISITDQKENVTFYSDDTVEEVIPTFGSKEVSLELGYLTPEIEAMISGNTYENGIYTQSASATGKEFALLFSAPLSRGGERKVCLFKGVLGRDESAYQGKTESVESSNVTISGIFMPLQYDELVERRVDTSDENLSQEGKTLAENWFVTVPHETVTNQFSARVLPS